MQNDSIAELEQLLQNALREANDRFDDANDHYHNTVEPGDGVMVSLAAGAGAVFQYERELAAVRQDYEVVQQCKALFGKYLPKA